MTCREVSGFLHDYVAGELEPDVLAEFNRHLDGCANCRAFLGQYRDTIALGREAAAGTMPDLPDDLVKAVLATLKK
ncbi:MAG TPA: zf-HC2 domain-containing protein [Vicinamibacterales bacterium]|nr:zf-HC2 domain-containing protein [Vicinamibacterales bacterium]